ncbi:MAG TPA: hypothetical protein VKE74_24835 [Gemmataceae bacterium]|nr:hypothetical protein [Gemmataceae bacterium]
MRLSHLLLLLACWCTTSLDGRTAGPQVKVEKLPPTRKDKIEPVPGYKLQKIEGVSFLIAEDVFKQDVSGYEPKPLEALELECKTLVRVLPPRALEMLRALVIWAEWDDKVLLGNGRKGNSVATYHGATPVEIVKQGKHPLQAKTITIHSLKLLTEGHQLKRDRNDCLLLHEFAHAVHDQLVGYDHTGIKAAYQQAMERKLYDKELYIATNEREFFAELTCTYLDRLRYYPYTRADLEKHDPVSFKLMESIWSGPGKKSATAAKTAGRPDGSDQFDLGITLPASLKFGPTVVGPEPTAESVAGKVVVIAYWGKNTANLLNRLDRLHEELAPYGVVAIAPCAVMRTTEEIKAEAEKRCKRVAVLEKAHLKDKMSDAGVLRSPPAGHGLVFDHAGTCVYRGSGYDADGWARTAVGRKLLADAVGGAEPPAAFKPVVDSIEAGDDPVAVLPKLNPLTSSPDEATKVAAKKLADAIFAPGQKALEDAQSIAKSDPVGAFVAAEGVAARYKNTPLASKAQSFATSLRQEKAVASELKARTILVQVQKAETYLRGQPGSFDPTNPQFQAKHQAALAQMKTSVEQLRKQYPNTRATPEAIKIASEFGIE